jgi:hypothetical protein
MKILCITNNNNSRNQKKSKIDNLKQKYTSKEYDAIVGIICKMPRVAAARARASSPSLWANFPIAVGL